jgi:hypothetical protein
MYKQPSDDVALFVCFDHCPTGYTTVNDPNSYNTCSGSAGLIIDYDLTYIERAFENLGVNGQNIGALASTQGG